MASKFDYDAFIGDEYLIAVSKKRYTKEEAAEIAKREFMTDSVEYEPEFGWVYCGFGTNDDGENFHDWWLVRYKPRIGCPVWVFREKERERLCSG